MQNSDFTHLRAAIYCRKSQESEERQVLSLPAQRDEAEKIAANFGIRNVEVYEEAKSAKESAKRREFDRLVSDVRRGKVGVIVCWKLDRLARNMIEGGLIIDLLQNKKFQAIITPGKIYYPNENALLMAVEFGAANQYSRDLSENIKRGQLKKAGFGYPPGLACIGYLNNKTGGKGERKWIKDDDRFPIVQKMFDMFLSGNYSGGDIHFWAVTEAGLTTPPHRKTGRKLISRAAVYRMLCSPIYAGIFHLQGQAHELSKDLPRAITIRQHYEILAMLSGRSGKKRQEHEVTYSGYIQSPFNEFVGADVKMQLKCDCGHKFSYANRQECPRCGLQILKMNQPKYSKYVYYRNVLRSKRKEGVKCLSDQFIDRWFVTYIKDNLLLSLKLTEWCKRYFIETQEELLANEKAVQDSRMKRRMELEIKKARYRDMLANGLITPDEYATDIALINNEIQVSLEPVSQRGYLRFIDEILCIGSEIVRAFESDDVTHKRAILAKLGSNFIWNEEKLVIINRPVVQMLIDGLMQAKVKNDRFEPQNSLADKDETGVFDTVSPILRSTCDNVRTYLMAKNDHPLGKRIDL